MRAARVSLRQPRVHVGSDEYSLEQNEREASWRQGRTHGRGGLAGSGEESKLDESGHAPEHTTHTHWHGSSGGHTDGDRWNANMSGAGALSACACVEGRGCSGWSQECSALPSGRWSAPRASSVLSLVRWWVSSLLAYSSVFYTILLILLSLRDSQRNNEIQYSGSF